MRDFAGGAGVYDDCFEMPETIAKGARNDVLYRFACSMRAKDVDPVEAWQQIKDANAEHCDPPIKDEVELRKLFQSAYSKKAGLSDEAKAAQEKAKKRKSKGGFDHDAVAHALVDNSGACMIDGRTPAVYNSDTMTYKTGWGAINKLIIAEHAGTTINNRREVQDYLKNIAPARPLSPWHLIAFQNGVYDLLTREFRALTKDDVITNVIPHDYDPTAPEVDTPAYKFIESLAGGDLKVIANLGETIGLCMLHDSSKFPFCPVLLGSGANGKSTYMKVLRWLLGDENVSNLQPKEIARRFQTCRIEGKLANLGDDIAGGYLDADACAIIKRVATGEMLEADVKNAMPYDFTPYVTMVFSANDFPRLADTSAGMMRRLHPIEFTQVFSTANGNKNIHLLEELQTEDNARAFLRLGIECLQVMCTTHEMTENAACTNIKQDIVTTNSTVLQWVEDLDGGEGWIIDKTKTLAYGSYTDWCRDNGIRQPVSAKTMSHELKNYLGIELSKFARDASGKRIRVFDYKNAQN